MKKIVKILSAVMLTALLFAGTMASAAKPILKVATDATFPPFESIDGKGKMIGFDIEIMQAIADEAGYELQMINVAWDGILPGLLTGNYDAVIAAMTITDDRLKVVNFSDPYFNAGQVMVTLTKDTKTKTLADLSGKKVAVQIGTTGDLESSQWKGVTVKRFNTIPEAFLDLKNGGVTAVIVDYGVAVEFAQQYTYYKVSQPFTTENYGIAVAKKNTKILSDINAALAKIKSNKKYDTIFKKYFSN